MTENINAYYEGARLSEAAYANFTEAMKPVNTPEQKKAAIISALPSSGFSEAQAVDFV